MAQKIAAVDAEAMNSLFASELGKMGGKTAADNDSPTPSDAQAFKDHAEYLSTLESILKDDKKVDDASANDPLVD